MVFTDKILVQFSSQISSTLNQTCFNVSTSDITSLNYAVHISFLLQISLTLKSLSGFTMLQFITPTFQYVSQIV